ncbi:mitochondrial carrier domain-containing protein [Aspergillus spectabilis]
MEESNTSGPVKEFVVGAAGGIMQVLIGQPFDIVKVRMRVQANQSAIQVARNIWSHEGVLAFYKHFQGTLPPLLGVGACISIVYTTYAKVSRTIQSLNKDESSLTTPQTYLAGGLAGLANSLISGPTEHIRIRLQTQTQSPPFSLTKYTPTDLNAKSKPGILSTLHKIHTTSGVKGLFRGQTPTMLREFGSYGIWFSVYELLLSNLMRIEQKKREEIAMWKIATCGIGTGLVLWTVNYPLDVVKSKMQADGFGSGIGDERRYTSTRDVVRQTWGREGVEGTLEGVRADACEGGAGFGGDVCCVWVEMVRKVIIDNDWFLVVGGGGTKGCVVRDILYRD